MSPRKKTLLLGSESRVAIAVARSLDRHSIPVAVAEVSPGATALSSRAVQAHLVLPPYKTRPLESAQALSTLLSAGDFDTVIPLTDTALGMCADHYDAISAVAIVGCPRPAVVRRVLDKSQTAWAANRCGVPTPMNFDVGSSEDLASLALEHPVPVIAKPRDKSGRAAFKVRYFKSLADVRTAFEENPEFGTENVIQEYVAGTGVGVGVLMHGGTPLATFQHRRLKELPATGGVSVMAVSERPDPMLTRYAVSLLQELEWEGVALVEFKVDRPQGRTVLMEVNGRYWGSISLALNAGMDFPFYHWSCMHGQRLTLPNSYKQDLRWRWLAGDLARLYEILAGNVDNSLVKFSRSREVIQFLKDFDIRVSSAVWSARDPQPAVSELLSVSKEIVRETVASFLGPMLPDAVKVHLRQYRSLPRPVARKYASRRLLRALRLAPRTQRILAEGKARSILIVCHGNIMRSAFAAALLRRVLAESRCSPVRVASAGTHAVPGKLVDQRAATVAKEYGVSLESHRAQRVTAEMLDSFDLIIAMDSLNEAHLLALAPQASKRIALLGDIFCPTLGRDIPDPYDATIDGVRSCFTAIHQSVQELARQLARIPKSDFSSIS